MINNFLSYGNIIFKSKCYFRGCVVVLELVSLLHNSLHINRDQSLLTRLFGTFQKNISYWDSNFSN